MKKLIVLAGLGLLSVTAVASDDGQHWYVGPQVGGTITDSEWRLNNGLYYGLNAGKYLNDNWAVELNAITGQHDGNGRNGNFLGKQDLSAYSLDALRFFNRDGRVKPFVTVGAGMLTAHQQHGSSNDNLLVQVGGGALVRVWQNGDGSNAFNIRPEVKFRWNDKGYTSISDTLVGVVFQFAFGAPTVHRAVATPAPVAAPVLAASPAPTPPAPPVVIQPMDSDGDGVMDDQDQCPGTPRGAAVDALGCPRKGAITLVGVTFENNSTKLKSESFTVLDSVANDLKQHSRLKVEVQGHTDSVGADAYNLKLSQGRADAVRAYLISQGVGTDQLRASGYGETRPIADNATAAGRAENRRVVMEVIDNPGEVEIKQAK